MENGFIDIKALLADAVKAAVGEADLKIAVTACQDSRFGDYQSNVAMALAKKQGKNPREVAQEIISKLQLSDICEKIDVAGAGFINFHLKTDFISHQLKGMLVHPQAGIFQTKAAKNVVIDFSSPNIAKSMHVGHIRSTFLGDSLARINRVVGHNVITDNHLGDWGTQFGMLIYGYKNCLDKANLEKSPIAELERLYKHVNGLCENDESIRETAKKELVKLQAGDVENTKIWNEITKHSLNEFEKAYTRMGIKFDHQLGESAYNDMLQEVVDELKKVGVARDSEGAVCIFFDAPDDDKTLADKPMLIQKADGGFLYATTDLATVLYRVKEWKAKEMMYVTDGRQQLHFKQLKAAVEKWIRATPDGQSGLWGVNPRSLQPEIHHIWFGSILGPDKKPFKTRSGDTVKLNDLLDEAESRVLKILEEKNPELSAEEKSEAARIIGIGGLKYADLSQNRNLDYIFDWNKLLALQGNTAPYLIYAYVRVRSVFRSFEGRIPDPERITLQDPTEIALAKHVVQFSDAVYSVLDDSRPHLICNYLYELASRFSKFYEACPILKAEEPARSSRLALADLTAKVLKKGLDLLGIETLEKM